MPSLDQPSQPGLQHLGVEHLPCGGLVGGEEVRAPGGLGLGRREGAQVVEEWRQPANSDGLCQDGREGGKVEKRKQLSLIAICTKLNSTIFKCLIFTGATRATLSARWRDNLERCGTVMLSVVVQVHQGEICHLSPSCNKNNQILFLFPSPFLLQPPPRQDGEHPGIESWRCCEDMRVKTGGACNYDICGACKL